MKTKIEPLLEYLCVSDWLVIDDAEMFTSEVHDPYARTTDA